MTHLAQALEEQHGTPFMRVSYFGLEDMAESLYKAARFFQDDMLMARTQALVREEISKILPELQRLRRVLQGKRAAIYVGGAFKAFSLVKALRHLGMTTVLVGSQTGNPDDYLTLQQLCDPGTVIVDDTNPLELAKFMLERDVDLLIGGVKERPIAYKLGIAFCDHNHERKIPLAGFEGMLHFAREVHASVTSPVWQFTPRRSLRATAEAGGAP
jgi:nitrogenase molybdenum-cofactor synthesis protein NifE